MGILDSHVPVTEGELSFIQSDPLME